MTMTECGFSAPVTKDDVVEQLTIALVLAEQDESDFPDNTYEEGVADALNWILRGTASRRPFNLDEYRDLFNSEANHL